MRTSEQRFNLILTGFLSLVVIFTVADMIEDMSDNPSVTHMLFELGVVVTSVAALVWLLLGWARSRREVVELGGSLQAARGEAERWRAEARHALDGLATAIDKQFVEWHLSPAESEIGLLMLKGLALKEVADLRGTSERTVRHQAQEIYRKAGLSGRADFAAFFLEDLLLPATSRT